jgi:uncharacterized protein
LSKEELLDQKTRRVTDAVLERFTVDYVAAQDAEEIVFTWHGGEPTLMGLPFFERVVELQRKHLPAGRRVSNDLQTNGTLLDEAWCRFLAEHEFLVGSAATGRASSTTRIGRRRARPRASTRCLRRRGCSRATASSSARFVR